MTLWLCNIAHLNCKRHAIVMCLCFISINELNRVHSKEVNNIGNNPLCS